ncbi:MAG: extracellular solute-binding protein [Treponema sp.]|nr:extracellular solute-binding protein [Treponema sp.]
MSKLKVIILISIVCAVSGGILAFLFTSRKVVIQPVTRAQADAAYAFLRDSLAAPRYTYTDFLTDNEPAVKAGNEITVRGDVILGENESLAFDVVTQEAGLYYFALTFNALNNSFTDITASLRVNGEIQYAEASTIILPVFWEDESKTYPIDKYGDESTPLQKQIPGPHTVHLFDTRYTTDSPLNFLLRQGKNTIEIKNETSQTVWLGNLTAYTYRESVPYRERGSAGGTTPDFITIRAADYVKKNSPHVSNNSFSSPHIAPYNPVNRKINTISSGRTGDEIFYKIHVPRNDNYAITFHYQTAVEDFASFVSVKIDGEFPFAEAASYALAPEANKWHNQTLTDGEGTPYLIYLSRGEHVLSIKKELSPVARQIRGLRLLIDHLNQFSIEIKKITGKTVDRNRTWRLTEYIPEVNEYLDAYDIIFRDIIYDLSQYSPKGADSSVISPMVQAVAYLEKLRRKYNELPLYIESLSGQDASVLQQAGVALDALYNHVIRINAIYMGRAKNLPRENASIIAVATDGVQKLWNSYTSDKYTIRNQADALNVWYASSYMQVDLLQKLIDTRFTPQTGIKVNLSVMPDASKLVMARAARTNPDIALGMGSWMPSELALRGALYDFSRFSDFWRYMGDFVPGALTSYVLNERVYAVPETITFAATIYRKDILGQLHIAPPDTWTDVTEMMAELQRFDMSFYMPIASGIGYKWFYQTSPLIYQNNGLLYRPDGLGTAINEANAVKGLTFLGDLFTTYALVEQVPNYFNAFRLGQTPVGIIDADTYILLTYGAPELMGQWGITPYPGTTQSDGSVSRWYIANGTGSVIFENTKKPDDCWEFLKWFLSEETQTDFAFSLFANYRIFHIPSNVKALRNIPIDDKDKQVILESVKWLRDAPRSPGQYLLERGLSDIWNTIVFDGTPPRVAIDRQVIEIQREFKKKMTEFGYLNAQGEQVKPYVLHEIDWIIEQIENAGAATN